MAGHQKRVFWGDTFCFIFKVICASFKIWKLKSIKEKIKIIHNFIT